MRSVLIAFGLLLAGAPARLWAQAPGAVPPPATAPAGPYAALRGEVAAAVAAHSPQAPTLADKLFRLDPNNAQVYRDLMDIYEAQNEAPALLAFFTSKLPTAPPTPTAQGYLHYYTGILLMQQGQLVAAHPHFALAKTQLHRVLKPNDPAFRTIEQGLGEAKRH
ncbi:hypothetical protein ACFQ48_06530 [Hymenobacter caeli]|uniref:Tetratricopeptide repeat protein n=1 Tax=Hymenobacter caeli TaxID=2735894 RepID=A0ABX2FNU0_9BACT|nr:hypothetical protein [Hymenobacter caeli]NRT18837.1 hypothetical protein [Hymenobacter caeli]